MTSTPETAATGTAHTSSAAEGGTRALLSLTAGTTRIVSDTNKPVRAAKAQPLVQKATADWYLHQAVRE